ncbi:MAG: hypothetical protein H6657_18165 [Ardenticatenaceae bacterium]|nr:hypothetical protein [Anaerolineales bacterium]MCB8979342.1 hypothetical protein [Ardenticatenaceae bacterium]
MAQQLKIAHLDETAVAKLRALEEETGKHIMAFSTGMAFAQLPNDQLQKVQALEKELGVLLLVYEEA